MPIISAAGIETRVIPTAVLSTHTGGFKDYVKEDLTSIILPTVEHWQSLGLLADAIYSGYLASKEQLEIVADVFKRLSHKNTLIAIDPVMGDDGVLYDSFDDEFVCEMRKFLKYADVVLPNLTEACLLLNKPYRECGYDECEIKDMLKSLCKMGPKMAVITGVEYGDGRIGVATFDALTDSYGYFYSPKVKGVFLGTGDVVASAIVSGLTVGLSLESSVKVAVDMAYNSIVHTVKSPYDYRYGVDFESAIEQFIKDLKSEK